MLVSAEMPATLEKLALLLKPTTLYSPAGSPPDIQRPLFGVEPEAARAPELSNTRMLLLPAKLLVVVTESLPQGERVMLNSPSWRVAVKLPPVQEMASEFTSRVKLASSITLLPKMIYGYCRV